jgi:hypothetical protein
MLALKALRRGALSEWPLHVPMLAAPIEAGQLSVDEGDDVGLRCAGTVIITRDQSRADSRDGRTFLGGQKTLVAGAVVRDIPCHGLPGNARAPPVLPTECMAWERQCGACQKN